MPSRVLALIPGNPGDAHYYDGFAGHLRGRGHEVIVFDHVRLARPPYSLLPYADHQAQRIEAYLRAGARAPSDVELVVVGHSIGGYIAHLMEKHALLPLAQAVLLFPFIARPALDALAALALWRLVGQRAIAGVRRLPRRWQRRLIEGAGATEHVEHVLATLAAAHAGSYAAMAATEFDEVARRHDAGYLVRGSRLAQRAMLTCIFTDGDRWSPRRAHPDVAAISYRLTHPVGHAFILEPASLPIVADVVEHLLEAGGRRPDPGPETLAREARVGLRRA